MSAKWVQSMVVMVVSLTTGLLIGRYTGYTEGINAERIRVLIDTTQKLNHRVNGMVGQLPLSDSEKDFGRRPQK